MKPTRIQHPVLSVLRRDVSLTQALKSGQIDPTEFAKRMGKHNPLELAVYPSIKDLNEHFIHYINHSGWQYYFFPSATYRMMENSGEVIYKKLHHLADTMFDDSWEDEGVILFDNESWFSLSVKQNDQYIPIKQATGFVYSMRGKRLFFSLIIDKQVAPYMLYEVGMSVEELIEAAKNIASKNLRYPYKSAYDEQAGSTIEQGELIIVLIAFIHFFETQKVVLSVNKRPRAVVGEVEYQNLSVQPVHVIDTSWYTTIIRTDPFLVSGHFRLQPHGPGRYDRKIIWINEFQKSGYRRNAKNSTPT